MAKRIYTTKVKQAALKMTGKAGLAEASRKLGIPNTTISQWRSQAKKAAAPTNNPAPEKTVEVSPPAASVTKAARLYSTSTGLRFWNNAAQHGIAEASKKFGSTRFSIYNLKSQVALHAQGKTSSSPVSSSEEDSNAKRDERILAEWKASAGLGPSQVRNQQRRGDQVEHAHGSLRLGRARLRRPEGAPDHRAQPAI